MNADAELKPKSHRCGIENAVEVTDEQEKEGQEYNPADNHRPPGTENLDKRRRRDQAQAKKGGWNYHDQGNQCEYEINGKQGVPSSRYANGGFAAKRQVPGIEVYVPNPGQK